jgi:phosphoglycolate phosphatase-like HAD superfamily hydrolase
MRFDAIVFDFDGVLVESTDIKTQAFGAMYAKYGPDIEHRVVEYHLAHAGLSRYAKFKVWQQEFLGMPYDDALGALLSEDFSRRVVEAIVAAPDVRGAREFLEAYHHRIPLFVASATPQDELVQIVERRRMSAYFLEVCGSPRSKAEILRQIIEARRYSPRRLLMVGDALADWRAAEEVGTRFVGRAKSADDTEFPRDTVTIPDLTGLPGLVEPAGNA